MKRPQGLSHSQVQDRLVQWGKNEIVEKPRKTKAAILCDQVNNPLTWLLATAVGASFWLGDRVDAGLILLIMLLNTVLGWIQEYKAEEAVRKLKQLTGDSVRVVREGREMEIDVKELVPGDVVSLEEGERAPADGILILGAELEFDEAVLTGESLPVTKKAEATGDGNKVFKGTVVSKGKGWMEVAHTGMNTRFGQLADKLQQIQDEKTPLSKKLDKLSRVMAGAGIGAGLLVVAAMGWGQNNWHGGVFTGISLAVAVIPEGLPAVLAVTLALGVQQMARNKAVVRKMAIVEALGATTVIATDKTGTITQNRMEVKSVVLGNQIFDWDTKQTEHLYNLLEAGLVCNNAVFAADTGDQEWEIIGDQTEGSLVKWAKRRGMDIRGVKEGVPVIKEYPFDSAIRLMTVVAQKGDEQMVFSKGAPEQMWERCSFLAENGKTVKMTAKYREEIKKAHDELAGKGLRLLAVGFKKWDKETNRDKVESHLIWLGMVAIADPLRPETVEVLRLAREAGIRVMMITGDSKVTASTIAMEAGMISGGERVVSGEELDQMDDETLLAEIPHIPVFARVRPEHKLRIVKALQANGEIVTMTGDGVNDALGIKQANVGVAMGRTGSDVAKETADVVLLDDNLQTVVGAVEGGRVIVTNIVNSVKYLVSCNWGELVTILAAVAVGWETPLLPVQILWINLVTDGLPALALAVDSPDTQVMKGKVITDKREWFLTAREWQGVIVAGVVMAALALIAFGLWGRAGAFNSLVAVQLAAALMVRGFRRPNKGMLGAISIAVFLQVLISIHPALRSLFKL